MFNGRKVSGLRAVDRAERAVSLFRGHFGFASSRALLIGDLYSFRLNAAQNRNSIWATGAIASVNRELVVLRRMLKSQFGRLDSRSPFTGGDSLIHRLMRTNASES